MGFIENEISEILNLFSEIKFIDEKPKIDCEPILNFFYKNSSFFLNKLISDDANFPVFRFTIKSIKNKTILLEILLMDLLILIFQKLN
jgi:hypothetical protein